MRADHPFAVLGQVVAELTFPDEDVEVVFPEIRHHLRQLALARHRARYLGGQQVVHEFAVALRLASQCDAVGTRQHGVAESRQQLLRVSRRVIAQQLSAGLPQGRESGQQSFGIAICHTLGPELLLDPAIDAPGHHSVDFARARPECESVQDMGRLFTNGQLAVR
jgi:hypothetical protein